MFVLDKDSNKIIKIKSKTFHELGYKEREHLQEWIADNPESLGEKLLIIQKEFAGFDETNERLDLLALDEKGTLVVIENKLDDTGKDVTWQALKYVSYCSTLTKQQIKEIYQAYLDKYYPDQIAEDKIVEFFNEKPFSEISLNENDQRIILVAAKFRKEVTSTVMWMLNHGIRVQCFKVTPYEFGGQVLLDLEQIIPVKEAEDYIIKLAGKTREEKEANETNKGLQELRNKFWTELLEKFNDISTLFKNVTPGTEGWLSAGSGVSGSPFSFVVTKNYAAVDVFINIGTKEQNKKVYDKLYQNKEKIEQAFGEPLIWERLDDKKSSRITHRLTGVDITNREDWEKIKDFLCKAMVNFEKVLKDPLKKAASSK